MSINKDAFIVGICDIIDEKLLENRMTIEGNSVALFLQDLTMYDDVNLAPEDFITKDGRFLFCLGKTLRESGYSYLDEVTVFSKCSSEITDKISAMGGYKTIQHLIDVVSNKNADASNCNCNCSSDCTDRSTLECWSVCDCGTEGW